MSITYWHWLVAWLRASGRSARETDSGGGVRLETVAVLPTGGILALPPKRGIGEWELELTEGAVWVTEAGRPGMAGGLGKERVLQTPGERLRVSASRKVVLQGLAPARVLIRS